MKYQIINQLIKMRKLSLKALRLANIGVGDNKNRDTLINNLKYFFDESLV